MAYCIVFCLIILVKKWQTESEIGTEGGIPSGIKYYLFQPRFKNSTKMNRQDWEDL